MKRYSLLCLLVCVGCVNSSLFSAMKPYPAMDLECDEKLDEDGDKENIDIDHDDQNEVEDVIVSAADQQALLTAIQGNDLAKIKTLLFTQHINPNFADNDDATPLMRAVENNNETVVIWLLSVGAEPNVQDGTGHVPLSVATMNGNISIVRMLLFKGANPDDKVWVDSAYVSVVDFARDNDQHDIADLLERKIHAIALQGCAVPHCFSFGSVQQPSPFTLPEYKKLATKKYKKMETT